MSERKLENSPIVYYVSGSEHTTWVLFLHAAFADHRMFDAQTAYFEGKMNVLTLDVLGHGRSTAARRGDSIEKMPLWIDAILKQEHIEKIHIVGVSLGAVLAQAFAGLYPEPVQSMACFGGYDIEHFNPKLQKENHAARSLMVLKAAFSVKWFARSNMKISAYTEKAQRGFYEMNAAFPRKSFRYMATLGRLSEVRRTVPRTYPLLIGCGEHDIPSELDAVREWQEREPDAVLHVFPGAGHCVNMDVPEAFNKALEAFWNL